MDITPDFYLTSTEVEPTLNPRKCRILQELWSEERGEYFLRIQIEPSIKGGHIRVDQDEVDEFVVATRHVGTSLHPLSEFPIWVYFCYILNDQIRVTGKVSAKDLRIILIGQLYSSFEEAEEAIRYELNRI